MYSTSAKTWLKSLTFDFILIGALVAGLFYAVPHAFQVAVFVLWWIAILGIGASLLMLTLPVVVEKATRELQEKANFLKAHQTFASFDPNELARAEQKLDDLKKILEKAWPEETIRHLAVSNTYLAYHWFSDAVVWVLLVIAGHPVLASFKVISFLLSCIAIGVARQQYTERFAKADKIDEEMAGHRKAVIQHNNVATGHIVVGNIHK